MYKNNTISFDKSKIIIDKKTIKHAISLISKATETCKSPGKLIVASYGQNPTTGRPLSPKVKHFNPKETDAIINHILANQDQHRNFYIPLCLMRPDLPAGKKGGLNDIVKVFGLMADFDDEQAGDFLNRLPLPPDFVMETSQGRFQACYFFDRALTRQEATPIAENLRKYANCDFGTKDLCHVWRIAGTLNWPNKKKVEEGRPHEPQIVKIKIDFNGQPTSVNKLKEKLQSRTDRKQDVVFTFTGDIDELPIKNETKDLIRIGAPVGQRSEAIMKVINALVFSNLNDSQIYSIFDNYGIGEKYRAQANGRRWLQPQITKARAYVNKQSGKIKSQRPVSWGVPVLFESKTAPGVEPKDLPGIIGDMAQAVSKETETPLELAAGMLLASVSAAVQGKFIISVKPGYTEPVNLWIVIALKSGNRKSAVLSKITKPFDKWESREHDRLKPEIEILQNQFENKKTRIKALRTKYAKAKKENLKEIEDEILDIQQNLPAVPVYPRVWAQDVTPEHLGTLLSKHNERMAILSAEGGIFDIMAGRYSGGVPNIDIFLQAHAGDSVRVDRGSRCPVHLKKPSLVMGLTPQPSVLQNLTNQPSFRGRGLLARFLYLLPESPLGSRSFRTRPVDPFLEIQYSNLISHLLDIETEDKPFVLSLSTEAYAAWLDFARTIEPKMKEGGSFEHITDWAGKLPGEAARIAGVLHCIQHPDAKDGLIDFQTMEHALNIAAVLSEHALIVFNLMGADENIEAAKKVWRWVERGRHRIFTKNDCFQALKGTFRRVKAIEEPLNILSERNYLRSEEKRTGGRPSIIYSVNPSFTKRWA